MEKVGESYTKVIVGIAGKSCTGKDTVADILSRNNYAIIDVDHIGTIALHERHQQVLTRFSPAILDRNGNIDRQYMARRIFSDINERRALEAILHPLMISIVEQRLHESANDRVAINAALLFYMRLHRLCQRVLWINALLPLRIQRAAQRDRLPLKEIILRISSQRHLAPQSWVKNVDIDTVYNNGSMEQLEQKLRLLHVI